MTQSTELLQATRAGDLARVNRCLNRPKRRPVDLNSPLIAAAEAAHTTIAMRLLSVGADINATDANGKTALHRASENGHHGVVEALIAARAQVNVVDRHGNTPLTDAAFHGHGDVVAVLIQAEAEVNPRIPRIHGPTSLVKSHEPGPDGSLSPKV